MELQPALPLFLKETVEIFRLALLPIAYITWNDYGL